MIKKNFNCNWRNWRTYFPAYSLANYLLEKNYSVKLTSDERGLRFLKDNKNFDLINIPSSPL